MHNEGILFLKSFCDFSNPNWVWILTGLDRPKENEKSIFFKRYILTNFDDIEKYYNECLCLMNRNPQRIYRIYISLNPRDTLKTFINIQKEFVNILNNLLVLKNTEKDFQNICSLWYKELSQSRNRGDKRFLLDIDTNDLDSVKKINDKFRDLNISVLFKRQTVNGYHYVFDACDTRELISFCAKEELDVQLIRDGMVFVERYCPDFK